MVRKRAPANDLDEGLLTGDGQEPDLEVVDVEPQPLPVGMTEEQIEEVTRLLRAGRRLPPNLFPHLFENESLELGEDIDTTALKEISNEDSSYPKRASRKIANKFDFRSPVNLVLGTHEPERSFLQRMFDTEVAEKVDGWVKAPDTGFYEISYSWRKGDHTKQGRFNPDLFIKLKSGKDVLVVELKDDTDDSDENRAKLRFATEHFDRVNEAQDEASYHGKHVEFDPIWSWPKPVQSPLPVYVGGNTENTLKRVIAYGDGWIPNAGRARLIAMIPEFRRLCEESGRGHLPITVYGTRPTAEAIADYEAVGVDRLVFWMPSKPRDEVLRELEAVTTLVGRTTA